MKQFLNSIILFSILTVFALIFSTESFEFNYLITLPLSVFVLTILFRNKLIQYNNSIVLILVLFQVTIRYLVLPLLMGFGSELSIIGDHFNRGEAIFVMILELFVVYLCFFLYAKRYQIAINNKKENLTLLYPNFKIVITIGILFLFILFSGYFTRVNYIWNLDIFMEENNELENVSSWASVLFTPLRLIASLIAISYIYKKRFKKGLTILLLFIVILLNSIIIVGSSRFSIVLSVLPLIAIIYLLFNNVRKQIIISFMVLISLVLSITTINKFARFDTSTSSLVDANSLNAYFSGPGNVSKGIDLYYSIDNWDRVQFTVSDLLQNIPIFSKFTSDKYKTNIYFNEAIYGHRLYQDQIVPLSLNGRIHLGVVGPLIYPFLFISLALLFERKYLGSLNIGYKLVFITLAITLSLIFMLNIGALSSSVFRNLIFLLVPIYLINLANKKIIS